MERHNWVSLLSAYNRKTVLGKILRYTIPFAVTFLIELLYKMIFRHESIGVINGLKMFTSGGVGPGSYYYPILIQFVFIFPIIYYVVKSCAKKGLLACLIANAVFEILKWAYSMNSECYRFMIFRYTFLIAFGCFIALYPKGFKVQSYIVSFVVGSIYIYLVEYFGYEPIFLSEWRSTSFITGFYIIPIYTFLTTKIRINLTPLEIIGKASYNIFLTQMVYYSFGTGYVYSFLPERKIQLLVSVIICLCVGIIFYLVEKPITKKIENKLCT